MKTAAQKINGGKSMTEMWEGFAGTVMHDAPPEALEAMKSAFFAGGLCLFNWFMVQLDEGEETTQADLGRVSLMEAEIKGFFSRERPQA